MAGWCLFFNNAVGLKTLRLAARTLDLSLVGTHQKIERVLMSRWMMIVSEDCNVWLRGGLRAGFFDSRIFRQV